MVSILWRHGCGPREGKQKWSLYWAIFSSSIINHFLHQRLHCVRWLVLETSAETRRKSHVRLGISYCSHCWYILQFYIYVNNERAVGRPIVSLAMPWTWEMSWLWPNEYSPLYPEEQNHMTFFKARRLFLFLTSVISWDAFHAAVYRRLSPTLI